MDRRWVGCDVEADFLGDDRKYSKQERRERKAKDRSKYKKTDKEKWLAQRNADHARFSSENLLKGRVLSINPEEITVEHEGSLYICRLRGLLKKEKSQDKNIVAVGDFVFFEPTDNKEGLIYSIDERFSILARADNLSRKKQQVIAANIDQVLITVSVVFPALKPFLVDRYIIATDKGGMKPVILINKIDLLEEATEDEKHLFELFKQSYPNIPVITVSTKTGEGIEELKQIMKDKASVFSGQSGVGKSSLINIVAGLNLKVGSPVEKTKKGAHTTTSSELIPLPFGGFCIDTPGIKSFGVWNLDREEIEAYFDEIHDWGAKCQFPDCHHLHEKNCAVKEAVEKGELSPLRYESYISLLETIEDKHLRR